MPSSAEDDNALSLHDDRGRQIDHMLNFLLYMIDVQKEAIPDIQVGALCNRINQEIAHTPFYAGVKVAIDWPFHNNIPEAHSLSSTDDGAISEDVEMTGNQDIFPPQYLPDAIPRSIFRMQDTYYNSDGDIPPQLYSANNQWINNKAIHSMQYQYHNHIPLSRGPSFRFPWTSRKDRRITDASQPNKVYDSRNLIEHRSSHQKALLIGIEYQKTELWDRRLIRPWKDVELMKNLLIGKSSSIFHNTDQLTPGQTFIITNKRTLSS
jgi:hypothetical protein